MSTRSGSSTSSGSGPGAITPDGCAVDFYAMMPARDEPEIIERAGAAERLDP
jgi:hypothetical protein